MNLRWLKDFVAVAEFGSFSKAADARAITQPAMSRHIKGLEEWVGVKLIDRSTFPARLTRAGEKFLKLARGTLDQLHHGVEDLRQEYRNDARLLRFSMQHVLASEFFSRWWSRLETDKGDIKVVVEANNLHDCMQQLESGQCHFLLCFRHPSVPLYLDQTLFAGKIVGEDTVVPVSAPDDKGAALYSLDRLDKKIPVVGSAPQDFMGQIIEGVINRNEASDSFKRVYEDSFSEGVRSQALVSAGLAWLPSMLVQGDLNKGRLCLAGDHRWQERLEILLYRRMDSAHRLVDDLWKCLSDCAE